MPAIRVVVVGNLVEDLEDGRWVPGGPALYAARMARALQAEVTLVTRVPRGYEGAAFEGIVVEGAESAMACRYRNTYDSAGRRTQRLEAPGEPLKSDYAPAGMVDALIVAPAYHEMEALPEIDARVTMVTFQGLLRAERAGQVVPVEDAPAEVAPFAQPGAFACLSDEDVPDSASLARWLAAQRVTAIVTHAARGATIYEGEYERHVAALPASGANPTGAGDCFAAAWAVRFAETGDLAEACAFALAAGALATEHRGPLSMPSRAEVERVARSAPCLPEAAV